MRCGVISTAQYNEMDGWYYVEGIIWDEKAQELILKGWSVSCSYDFLAFNDEGGVENNIEYDKEFTELNFTHLAIVDNPRYERANIVFNCKVDNLRDNELPSDKGKWITISGNHIFVPDGKTLDEVIKDKGWDKKEKSSKKSNKKDIIPKEYKENVAHYGDKEHYQDIKTLKSNISKLKEQLKDKNLSEQRKQSLEKRLEEDKEYFKFHKNELSIFKQPTDVRLDKLFELSKKENLSDEDRLLLDILKDEKEINNSKEIEMYLIDKLQELINSVKNNKENETMVENEKVDKRKLIDEVAGIMKSAGCDDEDIRTAIEKMEKIGYDDSEASADNKKVKNECSEDEEDKKVDNEEDEEEKVDNSEDEEDKEEKVDNESEEDKEKVEDLKEETKEDVDNKCKNSKPDYFEKLNAIYNSCKTVTEKASSYESRQSRLDAGKEYFG